MTNAFDTAVASSAGLEVVIAAESAVIVVGLLDLAVVVAGVAADMVAVSAVLVAAPGAIIEQVFVADNAVAADMKP